MATTTIIRNEATPATGKSPFLMDVQRPDPFTLVIFGATGDLTARKLLPALYGCSGLMDVSTIGAALG